LMLDPYSSDHTKPYNGLTGYRRYKAEHAQKEDIFAFNMSDKTIMVCQHSWNG
jgi:hypothetical protein